MNISISTLYALATSVLSGVMLFGSVPVQAQTRQTDTVYCASNSNKYQECAMPWRDARLVRQESKSACVRGRSWGVNRHGIWVKNGCRGRFAAAGRAHRYGHSDWRHATHHGEHRRGYGRDREIRLQCDSNKKRYQMCRVDVGRRGYVRLVHQMSDARCTKGYSWGYNRAGVWVSHGCRAKFVVHRRW
ncbi:hypothetical protein GCM10027285_05240 [Oleiagrimonas citrea]|uniref:DUF3011 domain-containing protein n=1 Tax=Oleiagrimonas citrea TaxID=1665687 RepID=A0A846ZNU1_9GAMM|nr:DUF3011 domain-containing protein [Oleiagrimonas citrea]NKZ39562.1 DUF3011 domain-containing protein [Oleiagrimonas citrea]